MASFPSSFNHVLRTNYAPSPDELTAIRKLISGPEEKIRLLNEKISELQAERDDLQSFVDDHRALLSPARRLPRDVVAEIFLRCLSTARLPTCDVTTSPLLLTTICRYWREVAITTPRLWRAVHFVLPTLIGYTMHHGFRNLVRFRKGGLQLWLCRAGSVPLTISCYAPVDDPKPQNVREELQTMYTEHLEILSRYSAQWQALYLSHIPQELLSPIRVLNASDVPFLRTLSLNVNGCDFARPWMSSSGENSLLNLMRAPSLRALHLRHEWGELLSTGGI
ncbi:hypothetical protein VNI00_013816 [Paramarasmius palmivorus]|uniref:F-box domain-containing protein n=1 Tax=Paramarasmius palmivorus TaxID=297713 RepID=A0AAW0BVY1_9AGAR